MPSSPKATLEESGEPPALVVLSLWGCGVSLPQFPHVVSGVVGLGGALPPRWSPWAIFGGFALAGDPQGSP